MHGAASLLVTFPALPLRRTPLLHRGDDRTRSARVCARTVPLATGDARWNDAALNPPSLEAWAPWDGISDLCRYIILWGGIPDTFIMSRFPASFIGHHRTEDFALGAVAAHPLMSPYWADKRPPVEQSRAPMYVAADMATVFHTAGTDRTPFDAFPVPETEYRKLYLDTANASLGPNAPAASAAQYDAATGETVFTVRFDEDVLLVGYPMARLFVEARNADDMDLFVLIEKLAEDGTPLATNSRGYAFKPIPQVPGPVGRLRVSQRELDPELSTPFNPVYSLNNPRKIKPGEIVAVDVAILPTAMRWHCGEGLRFTVSGHYVAPFPPTLNQGTHVIHAGGDHASYLQVPVVPQRD